MRYRTPTTLEALIGAIELLETIAKGGTVDTMEFHDRLERYRDARNEQQRLDMIDQRNRASIREMAHRRRYE